MFEFYGEYYAGGGRQKELLNMARPQVDPRDGSKPGEGVREVLTSLFVGSGLFQMLVHLTGKLAKS